MLDEGTSEEDIEYFSRNTLGYCPECGEEVWDDISQCPSCHASLTDGVSSRHPAEADFRKQSFSIIGIIVLIAFFWSLWRFF
jgi:hypothetical protein